MCEIDALDQILFSELELLSLVPLGLLIKYSLVLIGYTYLPLNDSNISFNIVDCTGECSMTMDLI